MEANDLADVGRQLIELAARAERDWPKWVKRDPKLGLARWCQAYGSRAGKLVMAAVENGGLHLDKEADRGVRLWMESPSSHVAAFRYLSQYWLPEKIPGTGGPGMRFPDDTLEVDHPRLVVAYCGMMRAFAQLLPAGEPEALKVLPAEKSSSRKLLRGVKDMLQALGLKSHDRAGFLYKSKKVPGCPIRTGKTGQRPEAIEGDLVLWWHGILDDVQREEESQRNKTASVGSTYLHGRAGEVAPEIGGHVLRSKKVRKAK